MYPMHLPATVLLMLSSTLPGLCSRRECGGGRLHEGADNMGQPGIDPRDVLFRRTELLAGNDVDRALCREIGRAASRRHDDDRQ